MKRTLRFAGASNPTLGVELPQYSRVLLPGGIEVIAAAPTLDGRAYLVPRWSQLDATKNLLVAEARAKSVKRQIDKNWAEHRNRIGRGVAEHFGSWRDHTFFIVGSGPGLLRNGHLLEKRPNAKVIALNAALKFFRGRESVVDWYFTLDWLGSKDWLDGVDTKGIELISSVTTPPELLERFERYGHFVGMTCSVDGEQGINEQYGHLGRLDAGLTGTYSAMHFAWRCGAKRIVLVGQDFAVRWGLYHWNEPLPYEVAADRKFHVARDADGTTLITDYQLERNMSLIRAAAMWCKQDGVEVVNATEGGILDWNRKRLADVLAELDAEAKQCPQDTLSISPS